MKKTAVIFSPVYYKHNSGKGHPESQRRLQAIIDELKHSTFSRNENWQFIVPEKAHIEDVELVHAIEYIRLVEAVCRTGGGLLDLEDTVVSPESFDVALYAVGGTLKAVNLVIKKEFENAFALVRPPGHHASRFRACGFCLFNNVSIAAEYLQEKYKLRRILILDIDAHHGNGTQETFYDTDKVLYISLHEDPSSFPGTGFIDEIGEGEGLGYKVNVPFPFNTGDEIYLKAFEEIVDPVIRCYKPQFMLVSAGFDGHYTDPVGNLSLSSSCYHEIFSRIVGLASETCGKKLVAVLEGGYSTKWVGKMATIAISEMSGQHARTGEKSPASAQSAKAQGERVIKEVKKVQKSFWNLK